MKFTRLEIEGLVLIEPRIFVDIRGYFFESYNQLQFEQNGIPTKFVQDNQSVSKKSVIRGLHFQIAPCQQGKLVSVIKGKVLDVVVDIRKDSPTFGKQVNVELDDISKRILWIPPGFAHGFAVHQDDTIFFYKCTNFYDKSSEKGIRFNDSTLKINWGVGDPIVSDKDLQLMSLEEYEKEITRIGN
jgi:dTDP-4-dehydrorhamnose 3,5-epimerase